jgi:hypothetical protein
MISVSNCEFFGKVTQNGVRIFSGTNCSFQSSSFDLGSTPLSAILVAPDALASTIVFDRCRFLGTPTSYPVFIKKDVAISIVNCFFEVSGYSYPANGKVRIAGNRSTSSLVLSALRQVDSSSHSTPFGGSGVIAWTRTIPKGTLRKNDIIRLKMYGSSPNGLSTTRSFKWVLVAGSTTVDANTFSFSVASPVNSILSECEMIVRDEPSSLLSYMKTALPTNVSSADRIALTQNFIDNDLVIQLQVTTTGSYYLFIDSVYLDFERPGELID